MNCKPDTLTFYCLRSTFTAYLQYDISCTKLSAPFQRVSSKCGCIYYRHGRDFVEVTYRWNKSDESPSPIQAHKIGSSLPHLFKMKLMPLPTYSSSGRFLWTIFFFTFCPWPLCGFAPWDFNVRCTITHSAEHLSQLWNTDFRVHVVLDQYLFLIQHKL